MIWFLSVLARAPVRFVWFCCNLLHAQVVGSSLKDLGELVASLKANYGLWTWGAGCLGDDGLLYMRLSAAAYNDISEYEQLRDAVLQLSAAKAKETEQQQQQQQHVAGSSAHKDEAEDGSGQGGTKRPRSTL
eukprot:COSAG06_NODE_8100_length_2273_cov_3.034039_2_plen_132_part_00